MKKNKIAIFATIALLAVGTAFGANKLRHIDNVTAYIKVNSVCTAITCATTGTTLCKPVGTTVYSDSGCTTAGTFYVPNGIQ